MARPKLPDSELIDRLTEVFRRHGYEGASLNRIAQATGLEKASLYHRFPGGKDEMAAAVVRHVSEWFGKRVFSPLGEAGSLDARVAVAVRALREYYNDGKSPCVLDTMTLPTGSRDLSTALKTSLEGWVEAFAGIAREAGATRAEARLRAGQAIVELEGALVVGRALGDVKPFERAIRRLPHTLLSARN